MSIILSAYITHTCGRQYNKYEFYENVSIQCGRCGETVYNTWLTSKKEHTIVLPPKPIPGPRPKAIVHKSSKESSPTEVELVAKSKLYTEEQQPAHSKKSILGRMFAFFIDDSNEPIFSPVVVWNEGYELMEIE